MSYELNKELACRVRDTVDAGLTGGLGRPVPGQMCVEAAVCYAMGLPHSDTPACVGPAVRGFKIRLNDSAWSSPQARAEGMRKLAVAQLGSDKVDQKAFSKLVTKGIIGRMLPIALRAAGKLNPAFSEALDSAAAACENTGTIESARAAKIVAYAAAYTTADAADAAAGDKVLRIAAEIGLDALIKLNSPGCKYLYLMK